jgi:hypothetical protein
VGRAPTVRPRVVALLAVVAVCVAAATLAQVPFPGGQGRQVGIRNIPYDGRFTFARIRYRTGFGGYYYKGLPAWAHGYPEAEQNLMKILNEVSYLNAHVEASNVLALDDPALFHFPVAYMTEAGYWTLTPKETAGLRAYLLKGGFIIFDDFRGGYLGGGGWKNFEANIRHALPQAQFVDLDPSNPIFHSFFEIDSFDVIPQFYDQGRPIFRGVFEDNDPTKRLMVMINFNTDVSNYWEFSATGLQPIDESNQAYKLGVNYVLYGMTH